MVSDVHKRSLGVWFEPDGTAAVRVWAPEIHSVKMILPSGDLLQLEPRADGHWSARTDQLVPGDAYQFRLNDEHHLADPASLSQPAGVHGPSQALDLSFPWTDHAWHNLPLESYIFYELHVGTFSPEGTFAGVIKKLPYLKALGITAIELMPVAAFPGHRNWGYDGVFPWAVHQSYGGARGLQELVDASHAHGLAVVLDVVYNHLGPEGNVLPQYGPYFTDKYKTPWGQAINLDDAGCDGVREYIIQNALMWFRDFHIDALRLDAVHALKDFSPSHILADIRNHVDRLTAESWRVHYLVAEVDLNDTRFLKPVATGGYGMHAQWIDEFHHALRVAAGQEHTGYYEDFDGLPHLAKSFRDAYVYDGVYSKHRKKTFGSKTDGLNGSRFVVFSQNHDHIGNRMLGERTSTLVSFDMLKVLAAATLLSPYLPLLFMGEEYGETNPFQYFVHHGDETLIRNVREGRKAEFAAFHAKGEAPDPQAVETFERSRLQWNLLDEGHHHALYQYYQRLIALRKEHEALRRTDRVSLDVALACDGNVLMVHRWHEHRHAYMWLNFSKKELVAPLPDERHLQKALDSTDARFGGNARGSDALIERSSITLQPESAVVYTADHV